MDIQLLMKKAQEMQTKVKKAQTELEAMIERMFTTQK